MIFIMYFFLSIVLMIVSTKLFRRFFNPFNVYCLVWLILIALYASSIIQYNEINPITWAVFFIVLIIFFIGSFLGYFIAGGKLSSDLGERNTVVFKESSLFKKRLETTVVVFSLVSFVFAVATLVRLMGVYGVNILSNIKNIYTDNITGSVTVSSPKVLLLNHIVMCLTGVYISKYGIKKVFIIPIINAIIDQLISGSRGMLITDLLFLLGPTILLGIKSKQSKVFLIGMVSFLTLFFILITVFRSGGGSTLPYASDFLKTVSGESSFIYSMVKYVTLPLAAFNEFLEDPFTWNTGQATFRLFYKAFSNVDVDRIDAATYATPIPTNVYTYLGNLHADFGFAGMIFGPFFLSIIFSFIYYRTKRRPTMANVCMLDAMFVVAIMTFFSWYVAYMYVMVVFIFGLVIFLLNAVLHLGQPVVVKPNEEATI